jgi:hypothetical protein
MKSNLSTLTRKYNLGAPEMARILASMGRRGDSLVAHITPEEAMMLKRRGGAGTINPRTGLLEFYGDPEGSNEAANAATEAAQSSVSDGGYTDSGSSAYGGNEPAVAPQLPTNFNEAAYLAAHPDVAAAVKANQMVSGAQHYMQYGQNEGRSLFNEAAYLAANPDVAAAVNAKQMASGLQHYLQYGQKEGRSLIPNVLSAATPNFSPGAAVPATPGLNFAIPSAVPGGASELSTLMRQYGIMSPSVMPSPSQFPTATAGTADAAKQEADKIAYQNYLNQYFNRLSSTDMYNRPQFLQDPSLFAPQWKDILTGPGSTSVDNSNKIYNMYSDYAGSAGFARGGYAEGGEVEAGNLPDEEFNTMFGNYVSNLPPPVTSPAPATPAAPTAPTRPQSLENLFSRYAAPGNDYTRELASARQAARTETEAFSNMIRQMSERGESPTSRAEMYFRLASAFGSPTKTGMFTENLALAGKEMGEYAKGRRTDEAERRGLALKAQELRMAGARQDLTTTQALAAQEGSERRAMAREILKEHLASGRPQSDAGKMAQDAGLVPGTQEYNQFVDRYIKTKLESGEMYRQAMLVIQEGNLEIRKMAEARQQDLEKQLTPAELKMKEASEGSLSAARSALRNIEEAIERNRNSFGTSAVDRAQYFALSRAGSTAPRVENTQQIENLLGRSAIDSLKEKFGAGITNEERRALTELEGALAKTPEERRIILERTRGELQRSIERESNRLRDISSGLYRQRATPAPTQPGGAQ